MQHYFQSTCLLSFLLIYRYVVWRRTCMAHNWADLTACCWKWKALVPSLPPAQFSLPVPLSHISCSKLFQQHNILCFASEQNQLCKGSKKELIQSQSTVRGKKEKQEERGTSHWQFLNCLSCLNFTLMTKGCVPADKESRRRAQWKLQVYFILANLKGWVPDRRSGRQERERDT